MSGQWVVLLVVAVLALCLPLANAYDSCGTMTCDAAKTRYCPGCWSWSCSIVNRECQYECGCSTPQPSDECPSKQPATEYWTKDICRSEYFLCNGYGSLTRATVESYSGYGSYQCTQCTSGSISAPPGGAVKPTSSGASLGLNLESYIIGGIAALGILLKLICDRLAGPAPKLLSEPVPLQKMVKLACGYADERGRPMAFVPWLRDAIEPLNIFCGHEAWPLRFAKFLAVRVIEAAASFVLASIVIESAASGFRCDYYHEGGETRSSSQVIVQWDAMDASVKLDDVVTNTLATVVSIAFGLGMTSAVRAAHVTRSRRPGRIALFLMALAFGCFAVAFFLGAPTPPEATVGTGNTVPPELRAQLAISTAIAAAIYKWVGVGVAIGVARFVVGRILHRSQGWSPVFGAEDEPAHHELLTAPLV